ncbi:MAG: sulfite exporter TauE/SafE family protein [Candidatus Thorarchaeota archaeon]
MFDSILIIILLVGLIGLFAALAGAVGIGGGAFFESVLMIIGGLSIFSAVPIASAIIVGVSFASTLVNIRNKTINYKIALILEPASIIGTIIGIQIHLISSEEMIMTIFSIILIFLTVQTCLRAMKMQRRIKENGLDPLIFSSNLSPKQILTGIIGSMTAGMMSALIGIGGGLIKVPMLNGFGLSPMLASGTGSFMVLFTSVSTITQFLFYQRLDLGMGILFFIVGFITSLIGTTLSRYNSRPEVILYFLTLAIGCSTILILIKWLFL